MRITLVQRYFWPDSILTNDIAEWLVQDGHDVEVIASQLAYHPGSSDGRRPWVEWHAGIKIRRVPLLREDQRGIKRHLNSLIFVAQAFLMILFGAKRDVVWTATMPPLVQAFAIRIATFVRGEKLVYFVQDIYPEIALAMSMTKRSALTSIWRSLDSWVMAKADAVVPHNNDMVSTLTARGVHPRKLALINNFAPLVRDDTPARSGPCRFIYAGNIGRFQNLAPLVGLFRDIPAEKATLLMLGEGAMKEELIRLSAGAPHIQFLELVPQEEAFQLIASSDVGIVSLAPTLYRYAFPGKTFSYLSAGIRVLALVEPESELASEIVARDVGAAVGWDAPPEQLRDRILALAETRIPHREIRERSAAMYDPEKVRRQWTTLFREVHRAA